MVLRPALKGWLWIACHEFLLISPSTIALVRERSDVIAIVSESVASLKKRGRSWVGLCPFHQEKSPSFHVNPERGFFHCFGCKASGSVIDFVMQMDGLSFPEAVRLLAERANIPIEEERGDKSEADRKKKGREELYEANRLAALFYEEQLRVHAGRDSAWTEIARRGLSLEEPHARAALEAFRIGYAPPAWDALVQNLRKRSISPAVAEAAGLIVPRSTGNGHYDRFRHRLMFPVIDHQGRVVAFSGRRLEGGGARDEESPKYINSPESAIYSKGATLFGLFQARHAIRQKETAIVVEGNFDVVTLHAHGVEHVVAPLGTAFTADQARLIKRFTESVVLLFDSDAAGRKAVALSRDGCQEAGISVRVASLPTAKDPDEFVREHGKDALEGVIARSRGILEHLIDDALDEAFVAADAFERAARVERVSKLLADQSDPLVRSMAKSYADKIAGRLDLVRSPDAFRALERSVAKALRTVASARTNDSGRNARISARAPGSFERAEMVGAILEYPELLDDQLVRSELVLLEGVAVRAVAAVSAMHEEGAIDASALLSKLPSTIRAFAAERLSSPKHDTAETARSHVIENAHKLRRILLSRETVELAREQEKIAGDWAAEIELAREATVRARLIHGVGLEPPAVEGERVSGDDKE